MQSCEAFGELNREKFTSRRAAASLHDCYSPPAKLHTVFTSPTIGYSNLHSSGRQSTVACLSCSTLFWILLVAAFIIAELGLTVILVHLSTRSLPDRR